MRSNVKEIEGKLRDRCYDIGYELNSSMADIVANDTLSPADRVSYVIHVHEAMKALCTLERRINFALNAVTNK